MSDKEIPMWAKERACELANAEDHRMSPPVAAAWKVSDRGYPTLTALARYIATHEQPPIDPLLVEAREIALEHDNGRDDILVADDYRNGRRDFTSPVLCALVGLKRGSGQ